MFAAARVLIKVSTPLSVEAVIAEVFSDVLAISGKQKLGLDDRPQELLKCHAVVIKKARHGSGRTEDDAEPACGFLGYSTSIEIGGAYMCRKKIVFLEDNEISNSLDSPFEIGLLLFS